VRPAVRRSSRSTAVAGAPLTACPPDVPEAVSPAVTEPTAKRYVPLITSPSGAISCQATVYTPGPKRERVGAVSCLPPSLRATAPRATGFPPGAETRSAFAPDGCTGSSKTSEISLGAVGTAPSIAGEANSSTACA
jgi:hypothetical protein